MAKKIIFTQSQIDKMIQMHQDGYLNKEIAKYFETSLSTINRRLMDQNVQSRHPRLSGERKQKAVDLYNEYHNISKVCSLMNISSSTVHNILNNANIHILDRSECKRKCVIDETYFDNIDTHRKAYYLGLLYADGTVSGTSNRVQISLQERDKDIIYQLQSDLKCDYKISLIEYNKKNSNHQNQYCLTISNTRIHDALIKHGVVPNKSLILEFPNDLNKEFYSSFILGYLDGDGTITKKEKRIKLISTESFCNKIAEIVKNMFGIHCTISYCHHHMDKSTRSLQIAGGKQVKCFLDWIYSKSDIYLQRKYDIYKNLYCVNNFSL